MNFSETDYQIFPFRACREKFTNILISLLKIRLSNFPYLCLSWKICKIINELFKNRLSIFPYLCLPWKICKIINELFKKQIINFSISCKKFAKLSMNFSKNRLSNFSVFEFAVKNLRTYQWTFQNQIIKFFRF